jgi:hypothetical protein
MPGDKRKSERQPLFKVCRYFVAGRENVDLSTNISEGGIFIKSMSPPSLNTPVILITRLPKRWGRQQIKLLGRVAWINEDEDPHMRGMGIEFKSVLADTSPLISFFVREAYGQDDLP